MIKFFLKFFYDLYILIFDNAEQIRISIESTLDDGWYAVFEAYFLLMCLSGILLGLFLLVNFPYAISFDTNNKSIKGFAMILLKVTLVLIELAFIPAVILGAYWFVCAFFWFISYLVISLPADVFIACGILVVSTVIFVKD